MKTFGILQLQGEVDFIGNFHHKVTFLGGMGGGITTQKLHLGNVLCFG